MITYPLALRFCPSPVYPAAAWFIASENPAVWVEEICQWGLNMAALQLYVLPRSLRDRRPSGVLVVTGAAAKLPSRNPRLHAYAQLADRLFIPVNARLFPEISDDELQRVLLWDVQILHPSTGLVGFKRGDAIRVHDLLRVPAARPSQWERAVAAEPEPRRLFAIEPDLPPTSQVVLQESRDDIGSDSPDDLPPSSDESRVKEMASWAGLSGLKMLSWLTGKPSDAGDRAGKSNLTGKLRDWTAGKMSAFNKSVEAARHKSVNRLMKMLESDPDQGLRYAIPLRGAGTRGRAAPGSGLPPRDVDFNLGGLRGGQPGDSWNMPWEVFQRLQAQYRAAASREMNLGRYRRAAYIYAHLLGDFAAAANALRQGRHYREAAVLYRDHLQNPLAAAQCLEAGGLLTEAIRLHESIRAFEKAGDLYLRMSRPEEARRAYRKAVEQLRSTHQELDAAGLLETKLNAPDEALAVLMKAWPGSCQASACLLELFNLLGRLGRHSESSRLIGEYCSSVSAWEDVLPLAEILADVAGSYPDAAVRHRAADTVRVMAGRYLPEAGYAETRSLVNLVMRLAAEDRLLARDGNRFLASWRKPI